jgi:CheY-like chemotaxis protein
MGGAIGVESVVDEGSVFWVELPVATALAGVGPDAFALPAAQPDAPETVAILLYVEDNPANLKLVEQVLRFRPGIALLTATDGRAGLELARARRPDLILLDLNLPELTGAEVLAALREGPATRAIPVVVISADATEGQRRRLLAAGAHDYLTKPLQLQRLLDLLDAMLTPGGAQ